MLLTREPSEKEVILPILFMKLILFLNKRKRDENTKIYASLIGIDAFARNFNFREKIVVFLLYFSYGGVHCDNVFID